MTFARYAIYFAPDPASELWSRGCRWLGRDAAAGCEVPRLKGAGFTPSQIDRMTQTPAMYGFHATLKPPFRLTPDQSLQCMRSFAAAFASQQTAVVLPGLRVSLLGNFIALVPAEDSSNARYLAAACVREFDRFRAQPDAAELARHSKAGLTRRQTELLERWGYPYVMEEFRFHMTLTGPVVEPERSEAIHLLTRRFADVASMPLVLDAIAIFEQPNEGLPFRIVERLALTGP